MSVLCVFAVERFESSVAGTTLMHGLSYQLAADCIILQTGRLTDARRQLTRSLIVTLANTSIEDSIKLRSGVCLSVPSF